MPSAFLDHQPYAGKNVLVWFRRDLRLADHAALAAALANARHVYCAFVFDSDILEPLLKRKLHLDRRVEFIHHAVTELDAGLNHRGGGLLVRHGSARQLIAELAHELKVDAVLCNHDYEPQAAARDHEVKAALAHHQIGFYSFKDQVIFERDELRTKTGNFYSVFTPYKKAWLAALSAGDTAERTTGHAPGVLAPIPVAQQKPIPSLSSMGFEKTNLEALGIPLAESGAKRLLHAFDQRIADYRARRDFPAEVGPSYLSVHLRFGTLSVRAMARCALAHLTSLRADDHSGAATWLSELIWRDFYAQILYHRPDLERHPFDRRYDHLEYDQGAEANERFLAWCEGRTGYPLVDAAMRQINQSGYMHNRLRMVTASFLAKDLQIDWRLGEQYFADRLNDFDLASNNGGWQWSASTGCDAQPFFRIFNPVSQSEKFDARGDFIRKWIPELSSLSARDIHAPWRLDQGAQARYGVVIGRDYPLPVVDHDKARTQTLARYRRARTRSAA